MREEGQEEVSCDGIISRVRKYRFLVGHSPTGRNWFGGGVEAVLGDLASLERNGLGTARLAALHRGVIYAVSQRLLY